LLFNPIFSPQKHHLNTLIINQLQKLINQFELYLKNAEPNLKKSVTYPNVVKTTNFISTLLFQPKKDVHYFAIPTQDCIHYSYTNIYSN